MELRQACLHMIRAYPGGWDAMAAALGMSRPALENRIYERKGQALLVETVMAMQSLSNTTFFAESVAHASAGVFVAVPPFDGVSDIELLDAYTSMMVDEGVFARDFRDAIRDGRIERHEYEALREDIRKRQAHEMELLARLESMVEQERD